MPQHYAITQDKRTARSRCLHRVLAEAALGRPLLSGEVIHHRDGNKTNTTTELVLPSQAYCAHLADHLHCKKGAALGPHDPIKRPNPQPLPREGAFPSRPQRGSRGISRARIKRRAN